MYACLTHAQNTIENHNGSTSSKLLLPYDRFLLPSGASFLHPYYIFPTYIPGSVGVLDSFVILNLAGDLWDPVLRAAGAELCDKHFPEGVSGKRNKGTVLCPHSCSRRPSDSLYRGRETDRMNIMQLLDWYCCSCAFSGPSIDRFQRVAVGNEYNVPANSIGKPVTSPLKCSLTFRKPDLVLFDPYNIRERNFPLRTASSTDHVMPHGPFTPGTTPSNRHKSGAGSVGSISAFSPVEQQASTLKLDPDAEKILSRLKQLSINRLTQKVEDTDNVTFPRVVSIDWVTHVIGLGEFIDYDASPNFSIPEDVLHHPLVIKGGNDSAERYVIDDVVYYTARTPASRHPFTSNAISDRGGKKSGSENFQLRMGRIMRIDHRAVSGKVKALLKIRPLFFNETALLQVSPHCRNGADEKAYAYDGYADSSDSYDSDSSVENLSYDASSRNNRDIHMLERLESILRVQYIEKDQLYGRPVIISRLAYEGLEYPRSDEKIYESTDFFEKCYSGAEYRRIKKRLRSCKRHMEMSTFGTLNKCSQDY